MSLSHSLLNYFHLFPKIICYIHKAVTDIKKLRVLKFRDSKLSHARDASTHACHSSFKMSDILVKF